MFFRARIRQVASKSAGCLKGRSGSARKPPRKRAHRTLATLVEGRGVGPNRAQAPSDPPIERHRDVIAGSCRGLPRPDPGENPSRAAEPSPTTGSDGTFQVDFPKSVSRVVAVVSAPGFALRAFDSQAGDDPLLLPVTDENGSLEITFPMTGDELMRKNLVLGARSKTGCRFPPAPWCSGPTIMDAHEAVSIWSCECRTLRRETTGSVWCRGNSSRCWRRWPCPPVRTAHPASWRPARRSL